MYKEESVRYFTKQCDEVMCVLKKVYRNTYQQWVTITKLP